MRPISLVRFNALAAYCRRPETFFVAEESAWFEHGCERVLGTIIRDLTDNDFAGIVLACDGYQRFRCVGITQFERSQRRAEVLLRHEMDRLALAPDDKYCQGDKESISLDFYTPQIARARLNPSFISLLELEGYSPAKGIIQPMMHWYEDADGNFVEQFQTTGFDARIWELYLFAAFIESGYLINRTHAIPDFHCKGVFEEFWVEAVTVNPTQDRTGAPVPPPPCNTIEEQFAFLRHYMPIKFGSPLFSKLQKKYWENPHVRGQPLLFAIQDFSETMSMVSTRSALPTYLYGYEYDWSHDSKGLLKIVPHKIESHQWGEKKIPSGFFYLPEAENVSAVVFSNSGTISKFNRMGVISGFGSSRIKLVREGTAIDHNPNATKPINFRHIVNQSDYTETWVEGLDVYHNPRAKFPITPETLPGAAHHILRPDGQIDSLTPEWHPLGSITQTLVPE